MEKAEEYYKAFVTSNNIVSEFNIPAEHSMVCYIYSWMLDDHYVYAR